MVKSRVKSGKPAGGRPALQSLGEESGESSGRKSARRGRRPAGGALRETRERIEVREEERSLTRELADWDNYDSSEFDESNDY